MKLIPQDKNKSCWYASAQMLIDWKRSQTQLTIGPDPSQLQSTSNLYKKDEGITDQRIAQLAIELGLRAIPPMTPTPTAIFHWLGRYGPLWVNGIGHITVVAGLSYNSSEFKLLVFDPLPKDKGSVEWRDFVKWYEGTNWPVIGGGFEASGRDTTTSSGIFLYVPAV